MTALPPQFRCEPSLCTEQRRVLEILAAVGLRGCDKAALLAYGFRIDMVADLVHEGLATARCEIMRTSARKIRIVRVRITDAGRRALEG